MIASCIGDGFRKRLAQTILTVGVGGSLAGTLWFATLPVASARLLTPVEMIEAGLPPGIMIRTAGRPQFLTAVCAAIKNHRDSAPAIAKSAVSAHHEYSGDIVATSVRCASGEKIDCDLTSAIVAAAVSAAPQAAAEIDDAAVATAPDCVDSVQNRTESDGKQVLDGKEVLSAQVPAEGPVDLDESPSNQTPPINFLPNGGGGVVSVNPPQLSFVTVCDNGQQRTVKSVRVPHWLSVHPGGFVGSCEVTPATSR
ncbi:MAG: hypothetical protein ACR2G0_08335 [Chthoniobacterales bacterium]